MSIIFFLYGRVRLMDTIQRCFNMKKRLLSNGYTKFEFKIFQRGKTFTHVYLFFRRRITTPPEVTPSPSPSQGRSIPPSKPSDAGFIVYIRVGGGVGQALPPDWKKKTGYRRHVQRNGRNAPKFRRSVQRNSRAPNFGARGSGKFSAHGHESKFRRKLRPYHSSYWLHFLRFQTARNSTA